MSIDKVPGAFWVGLIGAISSMGTIYLVTQYPANAPAWVAAALTGFSLLVGLAKVLWPTSTATTPTAQDGLPLPAGVAMAGTPRPSAVRRFFF
jgi:hypothetical protein